MVSDIQVRALIELGADIEDFIVIIVRIVIVSIVIVIVIVNTFVIRSMLSRSHVGRSVETGANVGDVCFPGSQDLRAAEIDEFSQRRLRIDHDVVRFYVPAQKKINKAGAFKLICQRV